MLKCYSYYFSCFGDIGLVLSYVPYITLGFYWTVSWRGSGDYNLSFILVCPLSTLVYLECFGLKVAVTLEVVRLLPDERRFFFPLSLLLLRLLLPDLKDLSGDPNSLILYKLPLFGDNTLFYNTNLLTFLLFLWLIGELILL